MHFAWCSTLAITINAFNKYKPTKFSTSIIIAIKLVAICVKYGALFEKMLAYYLSALGGKFLYFF